MLAFRSLLRVSNSIRVASAYRPVVSFSTLSGKESDDDFKPKSKVRKDTNPDDLQKFLKKIVTENPVMLFMKGTPQSPSCGFSYKAVQILKACHSDFASANVMNDPDLRSGLKTFSDWQTFPQLYVKGEFIGGVDIMSQMYQSGELQKVLDKAGTTDKK
ncbi:hypothetical protein WA158_005021 [Blastocystis sp. Blastoise]